MAHDHLHAVREHELREALRWFPPAGAGSAAPTVLELGAGTGHQAAILEGLGYRVTAVELPSSAYAASRVFGVIDYDGRRLPFDDGAFNVVFSSNVLEHVSDIDGMLAEIRRVLAPGGVALHVLPTPAWRVWTTLAHLPWLVSRAVARLRPAGVRAGEAGGPAPGRNSPWRDLLPSRHGERGNVITEALYFSRSWWRRRFLAAGFSVPADRAACIFYTGCMVLGHSWGVAGRARWSRWLGSACRIYRTVPLNTGGRADA